MASLFSLFNPAKQAEAHLRAGDKAKAAECFARAGDHRRAGQLAIECGELRIAVDSTLRAVLGGLPMEGATPQQAGELLASSGHHREAVALLELGGAWKSAADSAAKLGDPRRAARLYERARQLSLAAIYYERAQLPREAARVLELEAERLGKEGQRPDTERKLREVNQQRAALLSDLGRHGDAASVAATAGPSLKAARILEAAGKPREAIEAYEAMGARDEALRLLDATPSLTPLERATFSARFGRPRAAAAIYAKAGMHREAAAAEEAAGERAAAAAAWERAGDFAKAAAHYRALERWADEARCLSAAGNHEQAAAAYLATRDFRAAAEALNKAGKPVDAAACLVQVNDKDEAARLLSQVRMGTPHAAAATLMLVPILVEQDRLDEALNRLRMLPPETNPGGDTAVEHLYWQGRVLEALGRADEALLFYQKAEAIHRGYKDTALRLATLRPPPPAPPAAPPQPNAGLPQTLHDGPRAAESGPGGLVPGSLLANRYEIAAELGRGGMGCVYRARDRELGADVAIKTVLAGDGSDRLLREVQICHRVTHPNVVRVFDCGRFQGGLFLSMELLEGQGLDAFLTQRKSVSWSVARNILSQIAAGLDEAHQQGVLHRDLKPSNIFLTAQRVKILDFGIALALDHATRLTHTGHVVGTPHYMSPEQIRGQACDARSDLYSLGIVAFTILTGREPFTGSLTQVALQHLQNEPPPLLSLRADAPAGWPELIVSLLAKEPADRPATARDVQERLAALPV